MKLLKLKRFVHLMACVSALLVFSGAAFASPVGFSFDEDCNGTMVSSAGSTAMPCQLWKDPISGTTTVLYHLVGSSLGMISGDLLIRGEDGRLSDLLRFNESIGGVFVFSENRSGATSLADVGIPFPDITQPISLVDEVDLGLGRLGVTNRPELRSRPGFQAGNPAEITYTFVSEAAVSGVPEPATYLLIAGPLMLMSRLRRKK